MERIKVGIIGMGFIGKSHIDAVRRIGRAELAAVADENYDMAARQCGQYGIPKCYQNFDDLINDPEIQVVHNCTPNYLHLEINEKTIRAGKHVFSEKPLGKTSEESQKMLNVLKEYPDCVAGVNFCYRMNPLMQEAKERIKAGELGRPILVHGSYLQDWLLRETDYNWRIESQYAGPSRCVADIGSHWMDLAQNVLGSKIIEVCAQTLTALPVRKKNVIPKETFSKNQGGEYENVDVTTEDYAGVLLKFDNGTTGMFQCSQVSAGRKCCIDIEINGSLSSYQWQHETSDRMWKGNRDTNNELIMRNPNFMDEHSRKYTYLAAGHPEGWNDAFKNNLSAFYSFIQQGKRMKDTTCDFATFEEGHYIMQLTEAIIKSGKERRWVTINELF